MEDTTQNEGLPPAATAGFDSSGHRNPNLPEAPPKVTDDALSRAQWDTLVDKISRGACTPFLGAGAAFGSLPLGTQLANDLLSDHERRTETKCPLDDRTNLQAVTQYIAVKRQDTAWAKLQIKDRIRSYPRPDFRQAGEPHGLMARLPLPIYLTTNYDDFLFSALKAENRDAQREFSRWTPNLIKKRKSVFDDDYKPTAQRPVVFHLHGLAEDELQESIVVSEDDYVDFLVSLSRDLARTSRKEILPTTIRSAITSTSLLFIGYSLKDINFRVLLRGLLGSLQPNGRQLSLTVQYEKDSLGDLQSYLTEYFEYTFQLNFVNLPAADFCGAAGQA